MSIFQEVVEYFNKGRNRRIEFEGSTAVVLYDGDGNERLIVPSKKKEYIVVNVATVWDMGAFAQDISKRFEADFETIKRFRDIVIQVDEEDTPRVMKLSTEMGVFPRSECSFAYNQHVDFMRWFAGTKMTQTEFRSLLIEQKGQHDQEDLICKLSALQYKAEITYDASVTTERNYVIGYSEKDGKGGLNIPRTITVTHPVIAGAKFETTTVFEVVIKRPTAEGGALLFSLVSAGKSKKQIFKEACANVTNEELLPLVINRLQASGITANSPIYARFIGSNDETAKEKIESI